MKLLQVIPSLGVGGAERMLARLAEHLNGWGHDVRVLSLYDPRRTWIEAELRDKGVDVRFLGKRAGFDVRMIPRVAHVIRDFRPDVVHTHMYVLKYVLPALAISGRYPVVHTLHTVAQDEADRPSKWLQYVAFRAGVVPVVIGDRVAASMRELYGVSPNHVIPNGVGIDGCVAPPGAREALRAERRIPCDAPVFACVANFTEAKNHEALLRAFSSPRLRDTGAHLLLAGDGARRARLEVIAQEAGGDDRVHFLGVRSDVARVLAAADAFVLASRREGNPLSVMEAMAAGKPVVAPAVGCIPELVTDASGIVVAAGDERGLEAAMHEIATDLERARALGVAAAVVARERFDDTIAARSYEKLYSEVSCSRRHTKN